MWDRERKSELELESATEKCQIFFILSIHNTYYCFLFLGIGSISISNSHSTKKGMLATLITNVLLMLHDLLSFVCSFIRCYSHTTHTHSMTLCLSPVSINLPQLNTTADIFRGLKLIPSFRWLDCLLPVYGCHAATVYAVSVKRGLQMR